MCRIALRSDPIITVSLRPDTPYATADTADGARRPGTERPFAAVPIERCIRDAHRWPSVRNFGI